MPHHTDEFNRLLAMRERLWKSTQRALAESVIIRDMLPMDVPEPQRSQEALGLSTLLQQQEEEPREPLRGMRDFDDLVGAARFYGIPGAERLPAEQLAEIVAQRREMVQGMDGPASARDAILQGVSSAVGLGLIGVSQESMRFIQNFAERIPFMRDAVVRSETMREADRWFSMLEEGLTGDLPEERRRLARGVAGAVGMFPAAILTWQALGAVGALPKVARIGGKVSPLGRAMLRSGATEVVLQDPTAPLHEQGVNALIGTVFGIADVGGTLGRVGLGIGMGTLAGAVASEGDPATTLISAALGGATLGVGGGIFNKVRRSFPSAALETEFAGFRRPEGPTVDAAFSVRGPPQLGAGPSTALMVPEPPLVGAYPQPPASAAPPQLRGMLGLPPGPQEVPWGFVPEQGLLPAGPALPPAEGLSTLGVPMEPRVFHLGSGEAAGEAANLTKQSALIESPALPELNLHPVLDDSDVARAIVETFPGQVGVVQNVGDVATAVRRILMEQMPNGVGPQDFRVVTRTIGPQIKVEDFGEGAFSFTAFAPGSNAPIEMIAEVIPGGDVYVQDIVSYPTNQWGQLEEGRERIPAGTAWTRQMGGAILQELENRGFEPAGFYGKRVTGVWGTESGGSRKGTGSFFPAKRFPRPQTVTDLLISSGRPISNRMVQEYEQFGMFSGQRARLASGQEVVIEFLGPDASSVRPLHGGPSVQVATRDLLPMKSSYLVDDLPEVYDDFMDFARTRLDEQSLAIGALPIDIFSPEGASQLPLLMDEYLEGIGVPPKGYYGAALRQLLEQRHIEALRALAPPEETMVLRAVQAELSAVQAAAPPLEATIEELAAARGMGWVSGEGASGTLIDAMSEGDVRIPLDSEDSAREFLRSFQREAIDDSPVGPFPLEAMETPPGFSMNGGREPGRFESAEQWADAVEEMIDDTDELIARAFAEGGEEALGFGTALVPTQSVEGAVRDAFRLPPDLLPPLPPAPPSGRGPNDIPFLRALEKIDGAQSRFFMPTRNMAFRIDSRLAPLGIPRVSPLVEALQDARVRMVNEANPWEHEAKAALEGVRRELIRNGSFVDILFTPPEAHERLARAAGFTPREREALGQIGMLLQRFNTQEVRPFIPDLPDHFLQVMQRFEEGLPGDPRRRPKEAKFGTTPEERADAFVEKDLGAFLGRYFRSFYKVKYVNQPYQEIKALTGRTSAEPSTLARVQASGELPGAVSSWLDQWADDAMWGVDPSKDIVLKTAHGMIATAGRTAGVTISRKEVQGMFDWGMGSAYASILGDVDAFVRDLPQALIGIAHIGFDKGVPILKRLVTDLDYRARAVDLAYESSWIVKEHGLAVDPDIYGGTTYREIMPEREVSVTQLESVNRVMDFIHDKVLQPLGMQHGWQGSRWNPLRFFGWQDSWSRVWTGMSAYETAWDALRRFDAAKAEGALPHPVLEANLLKDARVERFQGPIQDKFLDFVRASNYEGAARHMGRQLADKQTRYGMAEIPSFWRGLGPVGGRIGMRWSSYNNQMLAELGQLAADRRIPPEAKAAYFVQMSAMQGLAAIAQSKTGWNFMRMGFAGSLFSLAGASMFGLINGIQRAYAYLASLDPSVEGVNPTQNALLATAGVGYGSTPFTIDPTRSILNPWAGVFRTAVGVAEQAQWGPEAVGRYLTTGQRGDPWTDRLQAGKEQLAPLWYGQSGAVGGGARD